MEKELKLLKSNSQITVSITEALLMITFLVGVGASIYTFVAAIPELKDLTKAASQVDVDIKLQAKSIDLLQEKANVFESRISKVEDRFRNLELSISNAGIKITEH